MSLASEALAADLRHGAVFSGIEGMRPSSSRSAWTFEVKLSTGLLFKEDLEVTPMEGVPLFCPPDGENALHRLAIRWGIDLSYGDIQAYGADKVTWTRRAPWQ